MKKILMIILILLLCVVWFAVGVRAGKIMEITGSFPSISNFFSKEVEVENVEEVPVEETAPEQIIPDKETKAEEKVPNSKKESKPSANYDQKYYLVSESTSNKSVISINSTCKITLDGNISLEGSYTTTKDEKIVIEIKNAYKEDEGRMLNGVSGLLMFDKQNDNTIKLIGMDIQKSDGLTDEIVEASGIKVGNVYTLE